MTLQIEITEQDLPVLSAVATQALELLRSSHVTHQKIEKLIRQDPALASRILHIANSPFYATRLDSRTIADAARKLGIRQMNNIILAAATGELFSADDAIAQKLWDHSQAVAAGSQIIAANLGLAGAEESYIAGLLHDIGKIIIYRQVSMEYAEMILRSEEGGRPLHELETEEFKFFTHMSIGAMVARKWRLSDNIIEAVRFHHDLPRLIPRDLCNAPIACAVTLANLMLNAQGGEELPDCERLARTACAQELDLSAYQIERLLDAVQPAESRSDPAV